MHIARIGAVKNLDCKHPNLPVGRGKNCRAILAESSYSQQHIIVFIDTQFAEGKERQIAVHHRP